MKQNRFKSVTLWLAVLAQVLSVLVLLGLVDISQSDTINGLIVAVLQLLVALGVLNNPTDKENI